jgi:hypothetical protein
MDPPYSKISYYHTPHDTVEAYYRTHSVGLVTFTFGKSVILLFCPERFVCIIHKQFSFNTIECELNIGIGLLPSVSGFNGATRKMVSSVLKRLNLCSLHNCNWQIAYLLPSFLHSTNHGIQNFYFP